MHGQGGPRAGGDGDRARLARIRGARVPFPVTEPGNPFRGWRQQPAPEPASHLKCSRGCAHEPPYLP